VSGWSWTAAEAQTYVDAHDAATLEREYSPSSMVGGNTAPYLDAYASMSAEARSACASQLTTARYGSRPDNVIDLFVPEGVGPFPLVVFFHGGYWRALSHRDASFPAPQLLRAGVAYASVGYTLAPRVSLTGIVAEARAAVSLLVRRADELRLDATRLTLGGHSAGAHLACVSADAALAHGAAPVGLVLVAGVFELAPLTAMSVNRPLQLTTHEVATLSPLRHVAALANGSTGMPVVDHAAIVWGDADTRAFAWQSDHLAAGLRSCGVAVDAWEAPSRNHFDLLLDAADPHTRLGAALRRHGV
jgi:arylformamidase